MELLCVSFSSMDRTKGETVHIADFFFFFPSSEVLLFCIVVLLVFFFFQKIFF